MRADVRVWAPRAGRVELVLDGARRVLRRDGDGWWHAPGGGDADYRLAVDGRGPFPDPRSPFQPAGVFGPSRPVDHDAFPWTDAGWQPPALERGIVYELHIGTFSPGATFGSAIERLDALVELGVTHVEIMPVNEFPGARGWGYDGVLLYAPHHAYGGPDGLKALVDACHARGLAVLLDVVYNHLGPSGNVLGEFGPYFTDTHHTPWGAALNYDAADNAPVRRFVCDNACMWLRDYHCDGLRLDAVHAIPDTSAVHILAQLADEVAALAERLGRRLVLVAESDLNDPRLVRSRARGGHGLDAQWSDDFHHALHAVLTGERQGYYADFGRIADIAAALERVFVYDGRFSPARGRVHGAPVVDLPGSRFVGCLQNHDQVGNRARGERFAHLAGTRRAAVGAALVLTAPFVPLLFQGEEWAASTPFQYFTDHEDAALARAVSRGRREEFVAFGWNPADVPDPQDPATYRRSVLDWTERTRAPHDAMLRWYRQLIELRHAVPALGDGRLEQVRTRVDEAAGTLVVERGPATIACNFAAAPRTLAAPTTGGLRLASDPAVVLAGGRIHLPPESVAICTPCRAQRVEGKRGARFSFSAASPSRTSGSRKLIIS